MCVFISNLLPNDLAHSTHLKGLFPVWVVICRPRCHAWRNPLPHTSHWNGLSELWLMTWRFKWLGAWKRRWHCGHSYFNGLPPYGFSEERKKTSKELCRQNRLRFAHTDFKSDDRSLDKTSFIIFRVMKTCAMKWMQKVVYYWNFSRVSSRDLTVIKQTLADFVFLFWIVYLSKIYD